MILNFSNNTLLKNRAIKINKNQTFGAFLPDGKGHYKFQPVPVRYALEAWEWYGYIEMYINGKKVIQFTEYHDFSGYGEVIDSLKGDLEKYIDYYDIKNSKDVELRAYIYPLRNIFEIYDTRIQQLDNSLYYSYEDYKKYHKLEDETKSRVRDGVSDYDLDLSQVTKKDKLILLFSTLENNLNDIDSLFNVEGQKFIEENNLIVTEKDLSINELCKETTLDNISKS